MTTPPQTLPEWDLIERDGFVNVSSLLASQSVRDVAAMMGVSLPLPNPALTQARVPVSSPLARDLREKYDIAKARCDAQQSMPATGTEGDLPQPAELSAADAARLRPLPGEWGAPPQPPPDTDLRRKLRASIALKRQRRTAATRRNA